MPELNQFEKDGVVYDLEDTTARAEADKRIPIPSTAEVGQTIVVTEVDENGKPTKWSTVGLSAPDFKYIRAVAPEDTVYLTITEDAEGNPLRFTEAYIAVTAARASDATAGGNYGIGLSEWISSFNSRAFAYGLALNADAWRATAHVRVERNILETQVMMVHYVAANIDTAIPLAERKSGSAIGENAYKYDMAGSARFSPVDVSIAYERDSNGVIVEHPLVIDGAMHTVTAGIDMATGVKFAAGTIMEVWYRWV